MLFNSIEFLIFLPSVFALYWLLQNKLKFQNGLVLVASYVFYGWWDWRFLFLVLLSTTVDYIAAIQIDSSGAKRTRKFWMGVSLVFNLGLLGFFKYYNFFIDSWIEAWHNLGIELEVSTLNIILPVGISFYTFQTLSYTIDVYRGTLASSKDFISFASYVSFFPQLVAGPIERASNLLPQFDKKRIFNGTAAIEGLTQITWGLFKKIVIADNCAVYVNEIWKNYEGLPGLVLFLGAVLFAIQIYGDFSGYSDIAIGVGKLFGFHLMDNFRTPYFSRDIAEFWRRWHISLSTWFRDYVYYPLGGSKGSKLQTTRNVFVIFIVSGFWHGANFTFIFWGMLNALYFLPQLLLRTNRNNIEVIAYQSKFPSFREFASVLVTFLLTCFAWIFFRAPSLKAAFSYIENMFSLQHEVTMVSILSKTTDGFYFDILPLIIVMFWFEWKYRTEHIVNLNRMEVGFIIICFLVFGKFINPEAFIYFQF